MIVVKYKKHHRILSLLRSPLLFFLIRYLPVENNLYSVYTRILLLGNLYQGLYMLFQTPRTEASTLTSSINDGTRVSSCRETLILFGLGALCSRQPWVFILMPICHCCQIPLWLILALKCDFLLLTEVLANVLTHTHTHTDSWASPISYADLLSLPQREAKNTVEFRLLEMLVSFNRADQRTSGPFSSFQCFSIAF